MNSSLAEEWSVPVSIRNGPVFSLMMWTQRKVPTTFGTEGNSEFYLADVAALTAEDLPGTVDMV